MLGDYGAWRDILIAALIICVVIIYPGGLFAGLQEFWNFADRRKTALMAAYRRRTQAPERAAAMGVTDRLIITSHGKISVCDTEAGAQTLLFIHGNSACKEAFREQFEAFRSDYRVVAIDLPGHGVSPNGDASTDYSVEAYAAIANEIVQKLGLEKPVVFGWSLGGYVALEYAAAGYPLSALAICGTSPISTFPDDMPRGYMPTPYMELAGKRFHSRHEKHVYAQQTVPSNDPRTSLAHQAVWRTDGRAREQVFARLKTVDWPRQVRFLREGKTPF
ncbi:unnamed protein product, partial [Laminaria digitata]